MHRIPSSPPRALAALALALAALIVVALTAVAQAAPTARLWARWTVHDPKSTLTVDHGPWSALLAKYVSTGEDGINRFDYRAVDAADRRAISAYVERLAASPVSALTRAEQLALWINLYNAATVRLILDHYPVSSIRKIGGLFATGPWRRKIVEVEATALSLDDIEHRILRPIWGDPRIHYAVNCAALGCPNLAATAYVPAAMEQMLEQAAHDYVNHPRGVRLRDHHLRVSSLYVWYKADFGGSDRAVIAHLRTHADPPLAAALKTVERIDDDGYDWALNDRAP